MIRLRDDLTLVTTVDFFSPIVDDPRSFGAIAAANALSDIYAMGAEPAFALNLLGVPRDKVSMEVASLILQGGAEKAAEAGIEIVGGHSVDDPELKYGLVVVGTGQPDSIISNAGARPGDTIYLTKPLGTGLISTAIKARRCPEELIVLGVQVMSELNRSASMAMRQCGATAATDVTGFGLIGHLLELVEASQVGVELWPSEVPFMPGVRPLADADLFPGGSRRNLDYCRDLVHWSGLSELEMLLLCDAQTSGGLLVSLPEGRDGDFVAKAGGVAGGPWAIGRVTAEPGRHRVVVAQT